MWIVTDLDHHALLTDSMIERSRGSHIIHSPLFLLNRDNWLGAWLAAQETTRLDKVDEIFRIAHNLGVVLL